MNEENKELKPMNELTDDVLDRINGGADNTCPHYFKQRNSQGQNICLSCQQVVG